jgi:phosphoglycolate phosphatase
LDWPRAILFDLDGTLIDSAPMIAAALNRVIAERGGEAVPLEKVRGLVSRGAAELVSTCFGACATDTKNDLGAFREIYRTLVPQECDLYPGARAALEILHSEGRQLAVCTNKPQALTEGILAALGLDRYFAVVMGGDVCTRPKPDAAHLFDILQRLGADAADAVYVGDSEVDGEAAQAAGLPFILVTFGYAIGRIEEIPHSIMIDHFRELPAVMRRLQPGAPIAKR